MIFKVVIFIYDSASIYFNSLISSLNSQTDLKFEVILFNDNFKDANLFFSELKMNYQTINLNSESPQDLRFEGLEILKNQKNSFFIFQDCDDLMELNRVEIIKRFSSKYKVVVNDLTTINENGFQINKNIWKSRLYQKEFGSDDITEYNFVGLGNTAIECDLLNYLPKKPKNKILAVDWYLFYYILKNSKATGYFTSETTTLYRQHIDNSIGIADEIAKKKIIETRNVFFNIIGIEKPFNYENSSIPSSSKYKFPFWWELDFNKKIKTL